MQANASPPEPTSWFVWNETLGCSVGDVTLNHKRKKQTDVNGLQKRLDESLDCTYMYEVSGDTRRMIDWQFA